MSIGEAGNPEDAHLFEQAIAGSYALLGSEDIDWSDGKYADRDAIIEACRTCRWLFKSARFRRFDALLSFSPSRVILLPRDRQSGRKVPAVG